MIKIRNLNFAHKLQLLPALLAVVMTAVYAVVAQVAPKADIYAADAPVVTSVSPNIITAQPSYSEVTPMTQIIINGSGFANWLSVTVGDADCYAPVYNRADDSKINCQLSRSPGELTGEMSIVVVTDNGNSNSDIAISFVEPPTVISISPSQGPIGTQTPVIITGTGFNNDPTLSAGNFCYDIEVISDTSLTCTALGYVGGETGMSLGPNSVFIYTNTAYFPFHDDLCIEHGYCVIFTYFDPNSIFTVTFEPNGGTSVSSQQHPGGDLVNNPTNPTKPGYDFTGWYRDSELTTLWDFDNDIVGSDMTLYAGWQIAETTVPGAPGTGFKPKGRGVVLERI